MVIKRSDGGYSVYSHKTGKRMSKPSSYKAALKRIRQIQFWKRMRGKR